MPLRYRSLALGLTSLSLLLSVSSVALAQGTTSTPPAEPAPAPAPPGVAPVPPSGAEPGSAAPSAAPAPPAPGPDTAAAPAPSEPAATAASVPSADAQAAALADAEAAELEQQFADKAVDETEGIKLDIYGFADFAYGYSFSDFHAGPPYDSFSVGNLNLYLSANLGDSWQSLAEVRFTYLPHGNTPFGVPGEAERTDTTVGDYTDIGRPTMRWGGIVIERAYLEYLAHPLFNVRAGHFLTPYGIWNVDHGSPVIIGARPPYIVAEQLLPKSQTGLEIYGTYHLDPVKLGYHLTLSNGRGPVDTYQDYNNNKAVGGRLFARADTPAGAVTLGVSGYTGRYSDRTQELVAGPDGEFSLNWPLVLDYNERSLAGDLKWEFAGLLVQGELLMNDVVYDKQRPIDPFVLEGPPGFLPDVRKYGGYALTGYRFNFVGAMPFVGGEFFETGGPFPATDSAAFFGGLNVRPTPRVVLKAQYTYSWWFPDDPENSLADSHYNSIDLQAAWSF